MQKYYGNAEPTPKNTDWYIPENLYDFPKSGFSNNPNTLKLLKRQQSTFQQNARRKKNYLGLNETDKKRDQV